MYRETQSYRNARINRRSELFEEFQTMKGTRNVTAAQTASGEAAQGARSCFSLFFLLVSSYARCAFLSMHARDLATCLFPVGHAIS